MVRATFYRICFALLVPGLAWGAPPQAPPAPAGAAPVAASDTSTLDAAAQAYSRGLELIDQGKREEGLAELERAYALSPLYDALYNIGGLNEELERWANARRAFELYLKLGGSEVPAERAAEVRARVDELSRKTATLNLTVNVPGAEIYLDGEPIRPTDIAGLVLDPGEHVVRASKPGFEPVEQVLRATDGETVHVVLPLAPASVAPSPPLEVAITPADVAPAARAAPRAPEERVPLWVPWTITGALAVGWATTAALAIKARHDRDAIENPETSDERIEEAQQLHMTLAIVSDILLVSTLASAGVSAYLTWWPTDDRASSASRAIDGISIGVSGHF
jgi:tetratricopeptide (TPR) repeat protein